MDAKTYLKVNAANFAFLIAGTLLQPAIVNTQSLFKVVHAQTKDEHPPAKVEPAPVIPKLDPNVDYVTPVISMGGPVVTNTFLASRIACDRLEVNGFEPLKLNDAILAALARKGLINSADIDAIVAAGKATRPLRIKPTQ